MVSIANDSLAIKPAPMMETSTKDTPPPRSRLMGEFNRYTSRLDEIRGPLRTTSDGNLLEEESGDWLVLEKPPHDAENRALESQSPTKNSKFPAIGLPESKNGATGLDNPRARKSLARVLKNRWTGSDRPPAESLDTIAKIKWDAQQKVEIALAAGREEVDIALLKEIERVFRFEIAEMLGNDWVERARTDKVFWQRVLQATVSIVLEH